MGVENRVIEIRPPFDRTMVVRKVVKVEVPDTIEVRPEPVIEPTEEELDYLTELTEVKETKRGRK